MENPESRKKFEEVLNLCRKEALSRDKFSLAERIKKFMDNSISKEMDREELGSIMKVCIKELIDS